MTTYSEYQDKSSSIKGVLVKVEVAKRVSGFTFYDTNIYVAPFTEKIIETLEKNGIPLASRPSIVALLDNGYFLDTDNDLLYVQLAGGSNPNAFFMTVTFHLFFSNIPANVHKNPSLATGPVVHWLPMVVGTSQFGFKLDNSEVDQIGNAIDGSGSVDFVSDLDFWGSRFDKLTFDNKSCEIYSWSPSLNDGEARLVYKGIIDAKTFSDKKVSLRLRDQLAELRAPVSLLPLSDLSLRISDSQNLWRQRRIYGRLKGHVATSTDQVTKNGYPLTGTFSVTDGSDSLSGIGTSFLSELSPNDEILLDGASDRITIGDVISTNTAATLSDDYVGSSLSGVTATVFPSLPKRYINRNFIIAGHTTSEPTTVVTGSLGVRVIQVASSAGMRAGDPLLVDGQSTSIQRISGDGFTIKLAQTLTNPVMAGDSVVRPSASNVYINDRLLVVTRDYVYDAVTGTMALDPLAEFNIAPIERVRGTSQFTSASRQVDGTNTVYTEDYKPGDWIKAFGQSDWAEVLYVQNDVTLFIRVASTYSATDSSQRKRPDIYDEKQSVLSLDVLGKTTDGDIAGELISTGPGIVQDLLTEAGLSAIIDTATFTTAKAQAPYALGLAIPTRASETKTKNVRDYINDINKTVFGSLVQDADFNLKYKIFNPRRPESDTESLDQTDIIGFSFNVDSKRIVKTAVVNWGAREYDGPSLGPVAFASSIDSEIALYLTKSTKEFQITTTFQDEGDADIFASRWAFLLSIATATLNVQTKLQVIDKSVTDLVKISHPKFYERIGTTLKTKYAAIQGSSKTAFNNSIELEDLANAFSRCSTITENTANNYDNANDSELILSGFITDTYGMMDNNGDTIGINLIW